MGKCHVHVYVIHSIQDMSNVACWLTLATLFIRNAWPAFVIKHKTLFEINDVRKWSYVKLTCLSSAHLKLIEHLNVVEDLGSKIPYVRSCMNTLDIDKSGQSFF